MIKEAVVGLLVTVVGGVAVYWFTTEIQNERQRDEQRQEAGRQQEQAMAQQKLKTEQAEQERLARERTRPRMSQVEPNINRNGSDYKDFVASGINECLDACAQESRCKAITFTKSSRQCWMKVSVPPRQDDSSYTSAVKVGG